jgi:hypothetical protein
MLDVMQILTLWVLFNVLDGACWLVGRFSNFLADQWLRRKGWDSEEEWEPLVDYYPLWRLIKGVEDMPPKTFRRRL